jgi:hypothetical protein
LDDLRPPGLSLASQPSAREQFQTPFAQGYSLLYAPCLQIALPSARKQVGSLVQHPSLSSNIGQAFKDLGCLVVLPPLKQALGFVQALARPSARPSQGATSSEHGLLPLSCLLIL